MKQRIYIITMVVTLVAAVVFYILGAEMACGGLLFSLILLYDIKHALEPTLKCRHPLKLWHIRRGTLKKFRVICIVWYTIIILASISSFIGHLCS